VKQATKATDARIIIDDWLCQTGWDPADKSQVLLFGSYARGEAGPSSDLDLLIVERGPLGQGKTRRSEIKHLRRALWDFRVPIDILIYTEDEVAAWRDSVNHVIARSLREGRTLYE
jgi:uncharacterized protein